MITQTAQKDQIDLSIGGASDKIKYYVNTGFYNETELSQIPVSKD